MPDAKVSDNLILIGGTRRYVKPAKFLKRSFFLNINSAEIMWALNNRIT